MHIFRHMFISILFALGQKKMSLKSDQLEVSGSVYLEYIYNVYSFSTASYEPHHLSLGLKTRAHTQNGLYSHRS